MFFHADFSIPQNVHHNIGTRLPLAFSLVVHNNIGLIMRQLQILFRPRHSFCLYVDAKAPQEFKSAVGGLVECYRFFEKNMEVLQKKQYNL